MRDVSTTPEQAAHHVAERETMQRVICSRHATKEREGAQEGHEAAAASAIPPWRS